MKFKEAFSTYDQQIYTVKRAEALRKYRPEVFAEKYKNSFVCPKCKKAPLSFHVAATSYFSTYPKAAHLKGCIFAQKMVAVDSTLKFAKSSHSRRLIQRRLQALIHSTMIHKEVKAVTIADTNDRGTIERIGKKAASGTQSSFIPRKRFDKPFHSEDFGCVKLFYGEARLQWEWQGSNYKILLYPVGSEGKLFGKIYVSADVYQSLPDQSKSKTYLCRAAFMAAVKERQRKTDASAYFEGEIDCAEFLQIEKL